MRSEPSDKSELVNQVLFGEWYDVLEERKHWLRIRLKHDRYEGWIDRKQFSPLSEEESSQRQVAQESVVADLLDIVTREDDESVYFPIFLGSFLPQLQKDKTFEVSPSRFHFNGQIASPDTDRKLLINYAFQYLHSPYLWGGRTPFGIDCSGFTQMVYRLSGHRIPRDASQQAQLGETLSFIEESEPGDLAFFDNAEGIITHVGIILKDNYIIHASGKVRLDRLDQSGIFNGEERRHTHKLRVIKKII
jgi:hypothetical protein